MCNYIIREINTDEIELLKDFLYEAIFQPDESNLLSREVINNPTIRVYIDNFGNESDDYCLVAEVEGKLVGAVWIRILAGEVKGYGNIDEKTPEFAISLLKEFRNKGIGTDLMRHMIGYMKEKGYKKTSLSVDKENYALRMYQNVGFKIIKEQEDDLIMVLQLKP